MAVTGHRAAPVGVGSGESGDTAPGPRINVILNWFEELKERVQTGR